MRALDNPQPQPRGTAHSRLSTVFAGVLVAFSLGACDAEPADVREWTPADHEPPPERPVAPQTPGTTAQRLPQAPSTADKGEAQADPALVDVAWSRNCARCHGSRGAGDGPESPMYRPPNLADSAFVSRLTDEEIASAIVRGRGKMPSFDLPPEVVRGLVSRVRSLAGQP